VQGPQSIRNGGLAVATLGVDVTGADAVADSTTQLETGFSTATFLWTLSTSFAEATRIIVFRLIAGCGFGC